MAGLFSSPGCLQDVAAKPASTYIMLDLAVRTESPWAAGVRRRARYARELHLCMLAHQLRWLQQCQL